MLKYIYYRICKDWERKQELNQTFWKWPPYHWAGSVFTFLFLPFAFLSGILMNSDNKLTSIISAMAIGVLAMYLCNRFVKGMQNYTPPERFKKFENTPLYCFTGPLVIYDNDAVGLRWTSTSMLFDRTIQPQWLALQSFVLEIGAFMI